MAASWKCPGAISPERAERVRAAGGLLIVDEVQSGFGRTGDHMWGFEQDEVVPDIVVMAKGIGNGFPLGAVLARREIAEPMAEKFLFHTYGANPTSAAAGRAVLKVLARDRLQDNAKTVGAALLERLRDIQSRHPVIGDVRGRGLMLAIEMVRDRKTKEPDPETTAAVFEECRKAGSDPVEIRAAPLGPAHGAALVSVDGRCRSGCRGAGSSICGALTWPEPGNRLLSGR